MANAPRSGWGTQVGSFSPKAGGFWGEADQNVVPDDGARGGGSGYWGRGPQADDGQRGGGTGFWGYGAPKDDGVRGSGGGFWGMMGNSYEAGGAIPEDDSPMMDTMGARMQVDINAALGAVKGVLSYGRQLHGLGGGDKQAASMPVKPFNETPKPQPMMPPSSLPYGPGEKPFGKRSEANPNEQEPDNDADDQGGAIDVAGMIPSVPHSETAKPQPMPGPLPPTSNPFGKRAEAQPESDEGGAIQTDDEEAA